MPKDTEVVPGATSTLRRRIYAKIIRTHRDACWRWTGKVCRKRGGVRPAIQIGRRGSRHVSVTRLLLALKDRVSLAERAELEAAHSCHHYWCVNPRHLSWKTRAENESEKYEYDEFSKFADAVDDLASVAATDVA